MAPSTRKIFSVGRRMLVFVAVGYACGALVGVLVVLAWLPGAMVTYSENPQFVDPRTSGVAWSAAFAVVGGALGSLVGLGAGVIRTAMDSEDVNTPLAHS